MAETYVTLLTPARGAAGASALMLLLLNATADAECVASSVGLSRFVRGSSAPPMPAKRRDFSFRQ
jgi:hypothetical protein